MKLTKYDKCHTLEEADTMRRLWSFKCKLYKTKTLYVTAFGKASDIAFYLNERRLNNK